MQVTIEEINSELCTIIWSIAPSQHDTCETLVYPNKHGYQFNDIDSERHVATALRALPRNPKPEDAALLYRYVSEGLILVGSNGSGEFFIQPHWNNADQWKAPNQMILEYDSVTGDSYTGTEWGEVVEITHAIDSEGNKINVAIEG
jgi:hypothetical protein